MNHKNRLKIGITQGDINGVGVEVAMKALANPEMLEFFTPVVFGNLDIIREEARKAEIEDSALNVISDYAGLQDGKINVRNVADGEKRTAGTASHEGGKAALNALEEAVKAIEKGVVDVLVTAPIDKHSILSKDFLFTGHTEYLEDRLGEEGSKALMILTDGQLRVSLVTTHLPISEVASHITKEKVKESIRVFNESLKRDFKCERPKIAVLALNPHCGDGGVLGKEDMKEIAPAVNESKLEGILAFGPLAADGLFGSGAFARYDGILAMYHDQGLAPFKALARGGGVNFTAGLPVVRTSPAHGTAYDIAGRGLADETSMREALYAALDIFRARETYREASANPLEIRERPQKENRGRRHETPKEEDAETLAAKEGEKRQEGNKD